MLTHLLEVILSAHDRNDPNALPALKELSALTNNIIEFVVIGTRVTVVINQPNGEQVFYKRRN